MTAEPVGGLPPAPTGIPDGGPVTIEYAPDLDGSPDPGEVVWTWIPYEEDPTAGKDRPVVVVGHVRGRLAAVALTSKHHDGRPDRVEIGTGAWDTGGRTSYAKLERIYGIGERSVRREGAVLDRARFDHLIASLRKVRGWPDVEVDLVT